MGSWGGAEAPVAADSSPLVKNGVLTLLPRSFWVKKRLQPQGPRVGERLNKLVDFKWGSIYGVIKGDIVRKVFNDTGD